MAGGLRDRISLLYPEVSPAAIAEREFIEAGLENLLRRLRYTDRVNRKKPDRRLGIVNARLRQGLLLHYHPNATLGDAFRSGNYSDLTATLLLALTLEELDIAYTAHVDHWTSYVIVGSADRSGKAARPIGRTETDRLFFRREYLSLLRTTLDRPLTGLSEAVADSLFYRFHYRPAQTLGFRELAAFHHFRRAMESFGRKHYLRASSYLDVATRLAPRPAFDLLRRACTLELAARGAPNEDAYVDQLFELWRKEPQNSYLAADLLHRFDGRLQKLIASGQLTAALGLLNDYTRRGPNNKEWAEQLNLLQRLRLLGYYQRKGQLVPALRMAEALLNDSPDDERFQSYVAELSLADLQRRYPEPSELVVKTELAANINPFLRSYDRYGDILLRESALEVRDLFAADREAEARYALKEFREKLARLPNGRDRQLWTLTAFIAASNYYFAREQYGIALDYVGEALTFDRASDFLLHQRDLLLRY